MKKYICAVIPARCGSRGVPNKNIKMFGGKPLIAYSIAAARKANLIDRIVVSTDSEEYAEIALKEGAEVPFLRPKEIAADLSKDIEFFKHLINWIDSNDVHMPDYLVHLRPTTPLRDPAIIDEAIIRFSNNNYTSLRSVHLMSQSAYKYVEMNKNQLLQIFSKNSDIESSNQARQSFPMTYAPNGYVDIVRTQLIKKNILHGDNVYGYITENVNDIDTAEDFNLIEYFLGKNPELSMRLFG